MLTTRKQLHAEKQAELGSIVGMDVIGLVRQGHTIAYAYSHREYKYKKQEDASRRWSHKHISSALGLDTETLGLHLQFCIHFSTE